MTPAPAALAAPTVAPPVDRRRVRVVLVGLMLGVSLAALDLTVVATAVRTIADDLGGADLQAFATTTYLIASAVTTPLYGRLSDLYGRKPLFVVAISVFVAGSLLCAVATSMYQLAAYRAVQGIGAGGLFSLSLTIIADLVPPRERARHVGHLITVYGAFGVLGPLVGGLLAGTDEILGVTGWRWVFLVNVPVGAVALLVVALGLRMPRRRSGGSVDRAGAATLTLGLVPLLVVADEGRRWGWGSYEAWLCYAVGLAGIVAFLLVERAKGSDALLPLEHFAQPGFRLGAVASVAVGFGMFGVITALPLYLQVVDGASPAEAGVLMMPLVLGILATSLVSGKVIERTGRFRVWPVLGSALMITGLLWMSAITDETSFATTAVFMFVFGVGLGGNLQPLTLAMQNAVPPGESGVATAAATFFRSLGGSAGAAVFLTVLFGTVGDRVASAFREAAATPEFQAVVRDPAVLAEPANRAVVEGLAGGGVGTELLEDSSVLDRLHPVLAEPFLRGFADATGVVFLVGGVVLVVALAAALWMEDVVVGHGTDEAEPDRRVRTLVAAVPIGSSVPAGFGTAPPAVLRPAPPFRPAPVEMTGDARPVPMAGRGRPTQVAPVSGGALVLRPGGGPAGESALSGVSGPRNPAGSTLARTSAESARPALPDRPATGGLLAELPENVRRLLVRTARPGFVHAGMTLFRQGDPGDTAYLVRAGRIEVFTDDTLVRAFTAGDVFGELALLGDGVRTATAVARRDSELLGLHRADFDRLLETEPAFARAIVGRLAARVPGPDPAAAPPTPPVVALVPAGPGVPVAAVRELATYLAFHLRRGGRVARLDADGDPSGWAGRLAEAEARHERVLLVAADPADAWARFCLRAADRPLVLADPAVPPTPGRRYPRRVQLVVLAAGAPSPGLGDWLDAVRPSAHHLVDPTSPDADVARLARRVTGRALGLVLSGGGARGLAHIGVVDVLRRAGAPIDRVGGTSMGAVVAGMVANGRDTGEMLDIARRELSRRRPFKDVVWPRHSLIRGARAERLLDRVFRDARIEDQRVAMFTVSADLVAAEPVLHRRGRIADAVALSVRLPGIAPPRREGPRLHVDGGILDNLPVEAMVADGEGPVVGSDVAPRFDATFGDGGRLPGIMETVGRSMTLAGARREAQAYSSAHTLLAPDLGDLGLFDFARLDELVDRGRAAAEEALPRLRGLW